MFKSWIALSTGYITIQWIVKFTVAQKCHGNFSLLTAISICSRQFQFVHGNFNLLTAISIYSRQFQFYLRRFQFTDGNFAILLTALSIFSRQRSRHFSLRSPPVSYSRRQWPCTKVKTQNQKLGGIYMKLGRTQTGMSSYRSPYISFHAFTWDRPKNELRPV